MLCIPYHHESLVCDRMLDWRFRLNFNRVWFYHCRALTMFFCTHENPSLLCWIFKAVRSHDLLSSRSLSQHVDEKTETTLLVHFFGKRGKAELKFEDFYK